MKIAPLAAVAGLGLTLVLAGLSFADDDDHRERKGYKRPKRLTVPSDAPLVWKNARPATCSILPACCLPMPGASRCAPWAITTAATRRWTRCRKRKSSTSWSAPRPPTAYRWSVTHRRRAATHQPDALVRAQTRRAQRSQVRPRVGRRPLQLRGLPSRRGKRRLRRGPGEDSALRQNSRNISPTVALYPCGNPAGSARAPVKPRRWQRSRF